MSNEVDITCFTLMIMFSLAAGFRFSGLERESKSYWDWRLHLYLALAIANMWALTINAAAAQDDPIEIPDCQIEEEGCLDLKGAML